MDTIEQIKKAVQDYIDDDQKNNDLYLKVFEAIKKCDGQKITKRIATTVQKALGPEYNVYFSDQYGQYHLRIKKANETTNHWKDFLIGYHTDTGKIFRLESGDKNKSVNGLYSERGFDYYNICFGSAAVERIKMNKKVLASGKLEKLAELHDQKTLIDQQIDKLKLESFTFPAMYNVQKALKK